MHEGLEDFVAYLATADAQSAPLWQLQSLAAFGRELPEPVPPSVYAAIRSTLELASGSLNVDAANRPEGGRDSR